MTKRIVVAILLAVAVWGGCWRWTMCRVYVGPDEGLVLTSKMGKDNPDQENLRVVDEGYKGVYKTVLGEGRHFYNPFTFDRATTPLTVTIGAEQIGVVESKSGKPLPGDKFLVEDPTFKGVWRQVLTPGKWRLNPVAFVVTPLPAKVIRPGYVGCVTHLTGTDPGESRLAKPDERGIQAKVVQPGRYYVNPQEYKVEEVEVGYTELSLEDVTFPSKDGFQIKLDITVVFGLEPENVPYVMLRFGNVAAIVEKVIKPNVESICRTEGSAYQAKDFIEGTTRETFQRTFTESLTQHAKERKITVITGLVRAIDVPANLREPIQQAKVAVEEGLTKIEQQETQKSINILEETKADVLKGVREVEAETERLIASVRAEGEKKVAGIRADIVVAVAIIEKEIAELEAERTRILGEALAKSDQMKREADADRLKQCVEAIGGPEAYANYVFAKGLPADFQVFIRYSGPGTFWTDLPAGAKTLQDAATMKILEGATK
ncbi:MAG: SPFH domain-containing protein [Planctomycetota bacterium]